MEPSAQITTVTPFVARLASWKLWVTSAAVFVPFAWMFFASSAPFAVAEVEAACRQAPPDMRFFTSAGGVTEFLDDCGPGGRNAYRNMQLADIFYPAVAGVFLASSLSLAIRRLSPLSHRAAWLGALPLAIIAFDYLENALAWLALTSYPDPIATSHLLGVASAAKTTTSWTSVLLLVAILTALAVQATRSGLRAASTKTPVVSDPAEEHEVMGSAS